jgi:2,4-diaminopentanoate dehydrogenase
VKTVKVLIWGFGAMGSTMGRMCAGISGLEISGVCDMAPARVGKSVAEALRQRDAAEADGEETGSGGRNAYPAYLENVLIGDDIDRVIQESGADVALLATDSFVQKALPKIEKLVRKGLDVVSTAEEMAYPWISHPEESAQMDRLARKHKVSILGTGINPGFVMDLLVVMLSGVCRAVTGVRAERVNSLSPYGPAVMEEQGVGLSPQEFAEKVRSGELAGHVGFVQSIGMVCDALGWQLDKPVEQSMEAIVSSVQRKAPYIKIEPGSVAGCDMRAFGYVNGRRALEYVHPQQIEPEQEGTNTGDYITIEGDPEIKLQVKPEIPGGIGTAALCVNMMPLVIKADSGLKTMLDLPVPRAIGSDISRFFQKD